MGKYPQFTPTFLVRGYLSMHGNALGTYLEHENSYLSSGNMSLEWILVHLDTIEGLEEHITLH